MASSLALKRLSSANLFSRSLHRTPIVRLFSTDPTPPPIEDSQRLSRVDYDIEASVAEHGSEPSVPLPIPAAVVLADEPHTATDSDEDDDGTDVALSVNDDDYETVQSSGCNFRLGVKKAASLTEKLAACVTTGIRGDVMFDGVTYDCGAIYDILSKLVVVSPSANVAAVVTGAQIAVVNSSAKSAAVEIAAKAAENSVPVVIENAAMAADKAGYSAAVGEQGYVCIGLCDMLGYC